MPKIIGNLRNRILTCAKGTLLAQGYRMLTIRGIALSCGVAVGTVYNYFPSKDFLVAEVILDDWQRTLEGMRVVCGKAEDVRGGLLAIFNAIRDFASVYHDAWKQYGALHENNGRYTSCHRLLIDQIAEIAGALLIRFGQLQDPYLPVFTAQMLLTFSMDEGFQFSTLNGIVEKLYS